MENECTELEIFYQQLMAEMKTSLPLWDDFGKQTNKLYSTLKLTISSLNSFLESFQKLCDFAVNAKGPTKELGSTLLKLCMKQRSIETQLKCFTLSIEDSLMDPLQLKIEEWKKKLVQIEREHVRDYKKACNDLKKATFEVQKLQKKIDRGKLGSLSKFEAAKEEATTKYVCLELVEKRAICDAGKEEQARYIYFIQRLKPVIDHQINLLSELDDIREILPQLIKQSSYCDPLINYEQRFHLLFNDKFDIKTLENEQRLTMDEKQSTMRSQRSSIISSQNFDLSSSNNNKSILSDNFVTEANAELKNNQIVNLDLERTLSLKVKVTDNSENNGIMYSRTTSFSTLPTSLMNLEQVENRSNINSLSTKVSSNEPFKIPHSEIQDSIESLNLTSEMGGTALKPYVSTDLHELELNQPVVNYNESYHLDTATLVKSGPVLLPRKDLQEIEDIDAKLNEDDTDAETLQRHAQLDVPIHRINMEKVRAQSSYISGEELFTFSHLNLNNKILCSTQSLKDEHINDSNHDFHQIPYYSLQSVHSSSGYGTMPNVNSDSVETLKSEQCNLEDISNDLPMPPSLTNSNIAELHSNYEDLPLPPPPFSFSTHSLIEKSSSTQHLLDAFPPHTINNIPVYNHNSDNNFNEPIYSQVCKPALSGSSKYCVDFEINDTAASERRVSLNMTNKIKIFENDLQGEIYEPVSYAVTKQPGKKVPPVMPKTSAINKMFKSNKNFISNNVSSVIVETLGDNVSGYGKIANDDYVDGSLHGN